MDCPQSICLDQAIRGGGNSDHLGGGRDFLQSRPSGDRLGQEQSLLDNELPDYDHRKHRVRC
jgi:hypothetical protein